MYIYKLKDKSMKKNIKKLVLEYQKFMDDILDNTDGQEFQDIINSKLYHPTTNEELQAIVYDLLKKGVKNLNCIDVSNICFFHELFKDYSSYPEIKDLDVSYWDMSNAETCMSMFENCTDFNCDLSNWNVSECTDLSNMFKNCYKFNADISSWDVSSCVDFKGMFSYCDSFDCDLSNWNVGNGIFFKNMFFKCDNLSYRDKIKKAWANKYNVPNVCFYY